MKERNLSSHADSKPAATTARNQTRSVGARKSTGKRVTKSGDSGKGSTRKNDIRKPDRPPKPAIKRSGGTKRSPPGGHA